MIDKSIIQATNSWPFVEARKLIKERQKIFEKNVKATYENSELLADNWNAPPISSFSLNQLRTRAMNAYNGEASGLWNDGYD